jgi:hypothetical protein
MCISENICAFQRAYVDFREHMWISENICRFQRTYVAAHCDRQTSISAQDNRISTCRMLLKFLNSIKCIISICNKRCKKISCKNNL